MSEKPEAPRCSCGHEKDHFFVSIVHDYSLIGWILQGIGASARPKALKWRCRRCQEVLDATADPALIEDYWQN